MPIEKTGGTVQTEQLGLMNNWKAEKRTGLESKSFEDAYKDGTKRFENAQKNKEKLRQYEQITSDTEKAKLQLFFETVFAQVNPHHLISSEPLTKEKMQEYMAQDFQTVYLFAVKQTGGKAIDWPINQRPTDEMFSTIEQVFNVNYSPEEREALGDIILGITKGKEAAEQIVTWKDKNYEELIVELNKPENLSCEGAILAYVAQDLKEQGYIVEINASTGKPQIIHLPEMSPLNLSNEAKLTDPQTQKLAFLISNLGHSAEAVEPNNGSVEYFFVKAKEKFNFTKPDGSEISWDELWVTNTLPASDPTNTERVENKNHVLSTIAVQKAELLKTINKPADQIGSHLTDEAELWYQRLTLIEANLNNPQSIDTVAMNEINDQIKTQDILDQVGIKAGIREENATDRIMKLVQSPELLTPAILIAIAGFFFGKNSPLFQKLKIAAWGVIGVNVLGPAGKELYDIIGDEIKTNDAIEKGRYKAESAKSTGTEKLNDKISNLTTDHPNGLEERFASSYTKMKSDFDKTPGLDSKYSKTDVQKAFLLLSYDQKFLSTSPDSLKNKNNYEMYYDKSLFEKNGLTNPDLMTTIINLITSNQGVGKSYTTMDSLLSQGTPKDIESGSDKNYLSISKKYDDFDRAVYSELSGISGYPLKSVSEMSLSIEASPRAKVESILKEGKLEIKEDVLWFDVETDKLKNVANNLESLTGLSPIEKQKVDKIAAIYREEYYRINIQQKGENFIKLLKQANGVAPMEGTFKSSWNNFVDYLSESSPQNAINFESWKATQTTPESISDFISDGGKAEKMKKEIQSMPGTSSEILAEKEKWIKAIDDMVDKLENTKTDLVVADVQGAIDTIQVADLTSAFGVATLAKLNEEMKSNPDGINSKIEKLNTKLESLNQPQPNLKSYAELLSNHEQDLKEMFMYKKAKEQGAVSNITKINTQAWETYNDNIDNYLKLQSSKIDQAVLVKGTVDNQWIEYNENLIQEIEDDIFKTSFVLEGKNFFQDLLGNRIVDSKISYYQTIDSITTNIKGTSNYDTLEKVQKIKDKINTRRQYIEEQKLSTELDIDVQIDTTNLYVIDRQKVLNFANQINDKYAIVAKIENNTIRKVKKDELQDQIDDYIRKFVDAYAAAGTIEQKNKLESNFIFLKDKINNNFDVKNDNLEKQIAGNEKNKEDIDTKQAMEKLKLSEISGLSEAFAKGFDKFGFMSGAWGPLTSMGLIDAQGNIVDDKEIIVYIKALRALQQSGTVTQWGINTTEVPYKEISPDGLIGKVKGIVYDENTTIKILHGAGVGQGDFPLFKAYVDNIIDETIEDMEKLVENNLLKKLQYTINP